MKISEIQFKMIFLRVEKHYKKLILVRTNVLVNNKFSSLKPLIHLSNSVRTNRKITLGENVKVHFF